MEAAPRIVTRAADRISPMTPNMTEAGGPKKKRIPRTREVVWIPCGKVGLPAELSLPENALGLAVIVIANGCVREAPHARLIRNVIEERGVGSLMLSLLTESEADEDQQCGCFNFNLPLLTDRLLQVTAWARDDARTAGQRIGYCATSNIAAAALKAAAELGDAVGAVVARGGRPDLVFELLPTVKAATLLIVGEYDDPVVGLNREAFQCLNGDKHLHVVKGAGHLFEEFGAFGEVARSTADWFKNHLATAPRADRVEAPTTERIQKSDAPTAVDSRQREAMRR